MNSETTIREALATACKQRGKQAEISKTFDVHTSTVKRWVDGGEIPPPILKLLDWFLFGVVPPRLKPLANLATVLEFDADEWAIIGAAARREGTTEARWIAGRIRSYLRFREQPLGESNPAGLRPLPTEGIEDTAKIVGGNPP